MLTMAASSCWTCWADMLPRASPNYTGGMRLAVCITWQHEHRLQCHFCLLDCCEFSCASGLSYLWEQARYDPVKRQLTCHISLKDPQSRQVCDATGKTPCFESLKHTIRLHELSYWLCRFKHCMLYTSCTSGHMYCLCCCSSWKLGYGIHSPGD